MLVTSGRLAIACSIARTERSGRHHSRFVTRVGEWRRRAKLEHSARSRTMTPEPLSLLETRVLGVLVEKQRTVPDTYPLSLNALVAGCNQKTSRDPILDVSEADVQSTLDALRNASLV